MNRVSNALNEGIMEEESSNDDEVSDEDDVDDDEMFAEDVDDEMVADEGPDNSMTLFQYQEGLRRDFLIRKNSHSMISSQKKGRLEPGDPNTGPSLSLRSSHDPGSGNI